MSLNYAAALSNYPNKGRLGLPEQPDSEPDTIEKAKTLAAWIQEAKHVVVHTGAGISTAAGIADFRGPNGVWTAEKRKKPQPECTPFLQSVPTYAHMALRKLMELKMIHFIVSQNVDGLHLRSGIDFNSVSELHGNFFLEECATCRSLYIRNAPVEQIGQKSSGRKCFASRPSGKQCRGKLRDNILDWEGVLPEEDLQAAESHSKQADLNIVLGSTLQIVPAGEFPLLGKRHNPSGRFVLVNLQKTKVDSEADLVIRAKIDDVFRKVMEVLGIPVPEYRIADDPVKMLTTAISHLPRVLVSASSVVSVKRNSVPFDAVQEDPRSKRIKQEDLKDDVLQQGT